MFNEKIINNQISITRHGEERLQQRGMRKSQINLISQNGTQFGDDTYLLRTQDFMEEITEINHRAKIIIKEIKELNIRAKKKNFCKKFMKNTKNKKQKLSNELHILKRRLNLFNKSKNKKIIIRDNQLITCYVPRRLQRRKMMQSLCS